MNTNNPIIVIPTMQNVDTPTAPVPSPELESRRLQKEEDEKYREAARRLYSGRVRPEATVNRDIDNKGAFIEITLWVPRREIE